MADFIKNRRELTQQTIEEEHKWWNRLLPSKTMKEYTQQNLTDFKTISEKERELFLLYLTTQIELARRASDSLITQKTLLYEGEITVTGMKIKAYLMAYSNKLLDEIYVELRKSMEKFLQGRKQDDENLKTLQNGDEDNKSLIIRSKKFLAYQEENFYSIKEELLAGFKDMLRLKIDYFRQSAEVSTGF
jgi:hypothetical protein